MSCSDWRALLAEREAHPDRDPEGWRELLSHLRFCAKCRREALAVEPALLFATLAPGPELGAADIDEMKSAVATLVRARRLGGSAAPGAAAADPVAGPRAARAARRRLAVAAALVAAALLPLAGARRSVAPAPAAAPPVETDDALFADALAQPVVEDIETPAARVYELPSERASVVLVVDARLDL